MATYECKVCGMSVNATCGHCDAPLENDNLKLPDGRERFRGETRAAPGARTAMARSSRPCAAGRI